MTNTQIAKTWFSIIALAFCYGIYCATAGTEPEGSLPMAVLKIASVIFSFWGMARLWKSEPKESK